jgi:hypothetical protein
MDVPKPNPPCETCVNFVGGDGGVFDVDRCQAGAFRIYDSAAVLVRGPILQTCIAIRSEYPVCPCYVRKLERPEKRRWWRSR